MLPLLFAIITAIIHIDGNSCICATARADFSAQQTYTLVIDPGHGGLDGGAVSASGQKESELNLAVSQKLYDLCRFFGQSVVLTRADEQIDYPDETATIREKKRWDTSRRVELINGIPLAVLISIHQNNYPDPRPNGTQVFYNTIADAELLASDTHALLTQTFCPESRRLPSPISDKIYIMKHVNCPAILVECGFLSNPDEAARLSDNAYQCKLAAVLCASYLQFLN